MWSNSVFFCTLGLTLAWFAELCEADEKLALARTRVIGDTPELSDASTAPLLLKRKTVRHELHTNGDQEKEIDAALKELIEALKSHSKSIDIERFRLLDSHEQSRLLETNRKKVRDADELAYKKCTAVMKQSQRTRLAQLVLQFQGAAAFMRADVKADLKLSPNQQADIERIREEVARKNARFHDAPKPNSGTQSKAYFAKLHKEALTAAVEVLDESQKSKWELMVGAEFNFSALGDAGNADKDTEKLP